MMDPMVNETIAESDDQIQSKTRSADQASLSPIDNDNNHSALGDCEDPNLPKSHPVSNNELSSIENKTNNKKDAGETLTDVSADDESAMSPENDGTAADSSRTPTAIVSLSKKSRPAYSYDPDKITLSFLFANKDGLAVTVECKPTDTVGEVKGVLLSVWPKDMAVKIEDIGGDSLRLICMGKGFLMPDSRTLQDCQVPVFKTHPTPINVSIKPTEKISTDDDKTTKKNKRDGVHDATTGSMNSVTMRENAAPVTVGQGCCVIL